MGLISQILFAIFIFWTIFAFAVFIIIREPLAFFRSYGFIVICVGYITIVAIYPILRKVFPEDEI